jgi:hypothetical protein
MVNPRKVLLKEQVVITYDKMMMADYYINAAFTGNIMW